MTLINKNISRQYDMASHEEITQRLIAKLNGSSLNEVQTVLVQSILNLYSSAKSNVIELTRELEVARQKPDSNKNLTSDLKQFFH